MQHCAIVTGKQHKDAFIQEIKGIKVNVNSYFEDIDSKWCDQLCCYAWMCGEEVGSDFIIGIEQFACNGEDNIRIASHRAQSSEKYQHKLVDRLVNMWERINSDHYFIDLSYEESQAKVDTLNGRVAKMAAHPHGEWFAKNRNVR